MEATEDDAQELPKLKPADDLVRDCSETFDTAISSAMLWGGTLVAQCRCGRVNFATGDRGMYSDDPEELDRLFTHRDAMPDRYIEHNDDSVGVVDLPAMGTMVWGCPCNALVKLEETLWDLRHIALAYYNARTEAEIEAHSQALQKAKAARKALQTTTKRP